MNKAIEACKEVMKAWQKATPSQQKHWSTAVNACAHALRVEGEPFKRYWTCDAMPVCNQTVIVSGGIAVWTGNVWLSMTGSSSGCLIQWPVKWWAPLVTDEGQLDMSSPPYPPSANTRMKDALEYYADDKDNGKIAREALESEVDDDSL